MSLAGFNTAAAKLIAASIARCLIGYGISEAIQHGLVSAAWASDPKHITTLTIICVGAIYEIEELVYNKWGIDIPGFVSKIVSLSKSDDSKLPPVSEIKPENKP